MTLTRDERRAAIALAKRWVADRTIADDVRLVAQTLLAAQDAFINRLAPIYSAALALVYADGSQDAKAWAPFRDVVLRCKAYEAQLTDGAA